MEKRDYKHGRFNILDTDVCQFKYEDYLEYCEEEDLTPDAENSEAFWDWCYEEADTNKESDLENMRFCKAYNTKVKVRGSVGMWDGKKEIVPETFDSVVDAIEKIMNGDYDKVVRAFWDNGKIEVNVSHHDGTNCFTISNADGRKKLPYLYAI